MKDEDLKALSPLAQELVQSGKGAHDPTPIDQERILAVLQQRIAAGEGVDPPDASLPPPAPPPPWPLISAGGIGAALIAAAVAWGLAPEPAPAPPVEPALTAPVAPLAPPPAEDVGSLPQEPAPAAEPVEPTHAEPAPKTRGSRLAEEVAILSRATTALHAGRAEEALAATAEHQQKFPGGLLSEERRSARAQALCLLGRTAEAQRELDRLSPTSPQAARARQRCGLE